MSGRSRFALGPVKSYRSDCSALCPLGPTWLQFVNLVGGQKSS